MLQQESFSLGLRPLFGFWSFPLKIFDLFWVLEFLFKFEKIVLDLGEKLLYSLISFGRCHKMFSIRILFPNFIILNFFVYLLYSQQYKLRLQEWDLLLDCNSKRFIRMSWFNWCRTQLCGHQAFIIMRNDGPVNLLSTCVVVIIPCILALLYVEIDWECCYSLQNLANLSLRGRVGKVFADIKKKH